MIHPKAALKFINEEMGYGVFATDFIPKGTMTYVKDALEIEITPEMFGGYIPALQEVIEKYSYIDEKGVRIISWDHAKYVNHCCQCNTMSTGYGFEIAIRDIYPGEEITDEYGLFNMDQDMKVWCDKPGCRGRVGKADWDLYEGKWDNTVKQALLSFFQVEQPLSGLLNPDVLGAVKEYNETGINYWPVRNLKHRVEEATNRS